MIRILDLFCGVGGVARGFQNFLLDNGIEFEYYAIDIDKRVLKAHKLLNPYSKTICRDAWSIDDKEFKEFDLIWASPPCETHSKSRFLNINAKPTKPDMRLYNLIERLWSLNMPFIVENVEPYYRPPIKPIVKVGRHVLWSNLCIKPFKLNLQNFMDVKDDIHKLIKYHEIPFELSIKLLKILKKKTRDALRDMVHWRIAYNIAKQVIPQVIKGKLMPQTKLFVFSL